MNCNSDQQGIEKKSRNHWAIKARILFIIGGIISTLWFLIRVIPKPSRASYPCMRAASPIVAAFVMYLLSVSGLVLAYRKLKLFIKRANYNRALLAMFAFIVFGLVSQVSHSVSSKAGIVYDKVIEPNQPIGVADGIMPGRVVWAYNPDATREECTNTEGDYWFQDNNTDTAVVEEMLRLAITNVANKRTISEAWDTLFKYHDIKLNRPDIGYLQGDTIVIKLNLVSSYHVNHSEGGVENVKLVGSSPQLARALLRQLINEAGVHQSDIYIGDPFREMTDIFYNMCAEEFPDVNYVDNTGGVGRMVTTVTDADVFFPSDGNGTFKLPLYYATAKYFINVPCLKSHDSAGITISAKNHQGSVQSKSNPESNLLDELHNSFPDRDPHDSSHYGRYRHLVDYMGHKYMGGNTILSIVDGLWSGRHSWGYIDKWQMPPFNNDYTSSVFVSQDRVAIESVCYDFLHEEYNNYNDSHPWVAYLGGVRIEYDGEPYPLMEGTTDYMKQAADPSNWPDNIEYDPENDGTVLESMGVYEHWNNADSKQYSRNLETGDGIELKIASEHVSEVGSSDGEISMIPFSCYPNPAENSTVFEYTLIKPAIVSIAVYNISGKLITNIPATVKMSGYHNVSWDVPENLQGLYVCRLHIQEDDKLYSSGIRVLIK